MDTSWRAAKQLVPALSPRSTTEESGLLEQNGAELTEETVTLERGVGRGGDAERGTLSLFLIAGESQPVRNQSRRRCSYGRQTDSRNPLAAGYSKYLSTFTFRVAWPRVSLGGEIPRTGCALEARTLLPHARGSCAGDSCVQRLFFTSAFKVVLEPRRVKQCQEDQLACLGDIEDLIASLSSVLVGGMVALRAWGELWVYFKSENRASEDTGDAAFLLRQQGFPRRRTITILSMMPGCPSRLATKTFAKGAWAVGAEYDDLRANALQGECGEDENRHSWLVPPTNENTARRERATLLARPRRATSRCAPRTSPTVPVRAEQDDCLLPRDALPSTSIATVNDFGNTTNGKNVLVPAPPNEQCPTGRGFVTAEAGCDVTLC
ncbi:hypothetical protein C7M84_023088 [Penaeus vannamei]|uniref:Uncharacterized protein n=1 Tax=Penaeus vannamei TaxID=6689 RepID=A0A423U4W3_PENVA|nr:hypothetical protein C7M84_023088 [Penaeus vannamei]